MSTIKDLPEIEVTAEYEFKYFDNPVPVVKAQNGHLYAALTPLCNIFGLNEIKEAVRIQQHTVLKSMLAKATITGQKNQRCLRIGYMATWLLNLPLENLPDPKDRKELEIFQRNAAIKLEEAFCAGNLTESPTIAELLEFDSPAGRAYKESLAILGLARDQLLFEGASDTFQHKYPKYDTAPC